MSQRYRTHRGPLATARAATAHRRCRLSPEQRALREIVAQAREVTKAGGPRTFIIALRPPPTFTIPPPGGKEIENHQS